LIFFQKKKQNSQGIIIYSARDFCDQLLLLLIMSEIVKAFTFLDQLTRLLGLFFHAFDEPIAVQ